MTSPFPQVLTTNCNYLAAKSFLFSIVEKWVDFCEDDLHVYTYLCEVKDTYHHLYHKALFHVLACPFCLERSSAFREHSHQDLWRIHHHLFDPILFELVQRNVANDPALYYLKKLYYFFLHEKSAATISRNAAAAGGNEPLSSFASICGKNLPSDLEIICNRRTEGYEMRIQSNVPIKLTVVFFHEDIELYRTNISQRIPRNLIPAEKIANWSHILLLRN